LPLCIVWPPIPLQSIAGERMFKGLQLILGAVAAALMVWGAHAAPARKATLDAFAVWTSNAQIVQTANRQVSLTGTLGGPLFVETDDGPSEVGNVHVVVDAAGNIVESSIVTSKNFALLDEAALDLLRRCSPLPAPPESALTGNRIAFDLPIAYALKPNASR
jgi:TonB family protein